MEFAWAKSLCRSHSPYRGPCLGYFFHTECRFSSSVFHWVRRFFIDVSSFDSSSNDLSVFLLKLPIWVRRFFLNWSVWFSSSVSHWVRRFFYQDRNGYGFSPITFYQTLIFFLSFPTGLGGFLSTDLPFFPPQSSARVWRFFIDSEGWFFPTICWNADVWRRHDRLS